MFCTELSNSHRSGETLEGVRLHRGLGTAFALVEINHFFCGKGATDARTTSRDSGTQSQTGDWILDSGSLLLVWSALGLLSLILPGTISGWVYLVSGIILSGLAFVVIGATMGPKGTDANQEQDQFAFPAVQTMPRSNSTRKTDPSMKTAADSDLSEIETEAGETAGW